jgi:protein-S-isoprenylcysteine O-methyltransferase Ste14
MNKRDAFIGSAAFFVIAPGMVAGLIPFLITHWSAGAGASLSYTIIGVLMILVGLAALIECFVRFASNGGTPAPLAPTPHLVVSGLYRFVRNPMYLAVLLLIFGQMFLFANAGLLAYGVVIGLAVHFFVLGYEEPKLRASFPEAYAEYEAHVRRWLPRLKPWVRVTPGL